MAKPVRIQRKRTKGFNLQAASPNGLPVVYVGRPTKWGNPYCSKALGNFVAAKMFLECALYLASQNYLDEIKGKNLACWCSLHEPCHADVLLELANREVSDV